LPNVYYGVNTFPLLWLKKWQTLASEPRMNLEKRPNAADIEAGLDPMALLASIWELITAIRILFLDNPCLLFANTSKILSKQERESSRLTLPYIAPDGSVRSQ
jgi:hypothetical protein